MSDTQRLHKVLSQAGLGSRREMERWIEAGLVTVNGSVAKLGDSVTAQDKINVQGRFIKNPLEKPNKVRILLYHKPIGEISSKKDPNHEKTVFDNLPRISPGRWIQVGRLDINTSGLLIFTNDGELANKLMHPSNNFEREYAVRVYGEVNPDVLKNLQKGVQLDDGMAKFKSVKYAGGEGVNSWYHVVLTEGRNREVRRLWNSQGLEVSRLIRIRYGSLYMPRSLARGEYQELDSVEVNKFLSGI